MVQIARDYHQALGMFLQISSLLESRGIHNDAKITPVTLKDSGNALEGFSISGVHKFESHALVWSCGFEVVDGNTDDEYHQCVTSLSFLKRKDCLNDSIFKMECIAGADVSTWRILTPFDEAFALIETVASKRVAERLLAGDMDHIEHSVALDIINALLPLVGATKISSEAPGPVTMPSPTNIPQIPQPAIITDPEAEPG